MRQVTIIDGATVLIADDNENVDRIEELCDDLLHQLRLSVQATCKHADKDCISTSESGSNTCFVRWYCSECKKAWNEELTPAEYERLLALLEAEDLKFEGLRLLEDDYTETEKAS